MLPEIQAVEAPKEPEELEELEELEAQGTCRRRRRLWLRERQGSQELLEPQAQPMPQGLPVPQEQPEVGSPTFRAAKTRNRVPRRRRELTRPGRRWWTSSLLFPDHCGTRVRPFAARGDDDNVAFNTIPRNQ